MGKIKFPCTSNSACWSTQVVSPTLQEDNVWLHSLSICAWWDDVTNVHWLLYTHHTHCTHTHMHTHAHTPGSVHPRLMLLRSPRSSNNPGGRTLHVLQSNGTQVLYSQLKNTAHTFSRKYILTGREGVPYVCTVGT